MSTTYDNWSPKKTMAKSYTRIKDTIRANNDAKRTANINSNLDNYRHAISQQCPADARFKHLIDSNDLRCVRCFTHINEIRELQA